MMKSMFAARANTQILEEASAWFIEASEGELDAGAREEFNRWLRNSPEHVRAYLETAAVWENAALIDKAKREDSDALVAAAKTAHNVVALGPTSSQQERQRRPARITLPWALASSVVVLTGAGMLGWWMLSDAARYRTGIGEQHSIALADGSTVVLNSSSRIRVDFSDTRRGIELLQGQALFDVARDSARPFTVRSGGTEVTAIGTQFDVDLRHKGIVVTVLEGRVSLVSSEPNAQTTPTLLSAGEQVTVAARAIAPKRVDVAAATAWTQRRLVFSSTPLNEVAEEYNRYHARRLTIRSAGLEDLNISGTFSAADAASLIDFLRAQPGVAVRETPSEVQIAAAPRSGSEPK